MGFGCGEATLEHSDVLLGHISQSFSTRKGGGGGAETDGGGDGRRRSRDFNRGNEGRPSPRPHKRQTAPFVANLDRPGTLDRDMRKTRHKTRIWASLTSGELGTEGFGQMPVFTMQRHLLAD